MILKTITITNFRSIKNAHKIKLSSLTTIVGRNNEGKSNILKALNIAMNMIRKRTTPSGRMLKRGYSDETFYNWERDFPVEYQENPGSRKTVFTLEFALTPEEQNEFKSTLRSRVNGFIPIHIEIDKTGKPSLRVKKKGIAGRALTDKSEKVAEFIARKIFFNYIPAIRTDVDAMNVIQDLVRTEFERLNSNPEYIEALNRLKQFRTPILKEVSNSIVGSLKEFINPIKSVDIDVEDSNYRGVGYRSEIDITIDDGTPTSLEFKGDGVKSLVTLGLLKNRYTSGIPSIIAIEEPESHLHPLAIHTLRSVISDLATKSQVIISTHNPLFVNRSDLSSNILIENGKAIQSPSIQKIRDSLGVRVSDNLQSARLVILVEGESDVKVLSAFIRHFTPRLHTLIQNGVVKLSSTEGTKNLVANLSFFNANLTETFSIIDSDQAGQTAIKQAIERIKLKPADYIMLTNTKQTRESELENAFKPQSYISVINEYLGCTVPDHAFNTNKKWTDNLQNAVTSLAGKQWDKTTELDIKHRVAEKIAERIADAYDEARCPALLNGLKSLQERFTGKP